MSWYRVLMYRSYRRARCRVFFTELSKMLGTSIDVVPIAVPTPVHTSIPVQDVQVLRSYRTYRSVRCRYRYRTELTDVYDMSYWTYRSVRYRYWCTELTGVSGNGIDNVQNLPKCAVPILMFYRSDRSVRYRYASLHQYRRYRCTCLSDLTEVSGTGFDVVPNLPKCPVPVSLSFWTYRSVRCQ